MPLSAGEKLGPYELQSLLGEGGMGQVWKARDTRLNRTVALKVSKERFNERFEREARAIASLNHPHICTLFDVGADFLVMEYVDGKPIAGPLPAATALRYGMQIAQALDAAHRIGIVHRDLKPGNILITKSGIKLLDFGLAKVTAIAAAAPEETVTRALTEEGAILGTLQYMSPEQLEGKDADARSDIFALGCVLHEALTGEPPFTGGSRASVIAAIMDREPKPAAGAPPALQSALRRSLAKDPDARWQSARDLAGVLELAAAPSAFESARPAPRIPKFAVAALAALSLASLAAAFWFSQRKPEERFWTGESLGGPAQALGPRVSPDGQTIAFQAMVDGQTQVAVMKPQSGNWVVLTHQKDYGQIRDIAWSRDGAKLYFDRAADIPRGIFSVPMLGGEPRMVLEAASVPCVLADGSLLVHRINAQRDTQLYHYWPESGKIDPLPALADDSFGVASRAMPDGRAVVFFGNPLNDKRDKGPRGIYTLNLESRKMVSVASKQVFSSRHLGTALAVTPDGRSIVYSAFGSGLNSIVSVPSDGSGEMRQLFTLTGDPWYLDVAPDGSIYADQVSQNNMILRFPPSGGVPERLGKAQDKAAELALVLPDGRPLVYTVSGFRRRFQIVQSDGVLSPLIEGSEEYGMPAALAGDREIAVLSDRIPLQIAIVSIADGRIVRRVQVEARSISSLASSPDGKTFYFSSAGFVWSVPATGGNPRKLAPGDAVSADAGGRDLIVSLHDKDAIRLQRLPVGGGDPQAIALQGELRIPETPLTSSMIGPGGRIVVEIASPAEWAWRVGTIDLHAGKISLIPVNFEGETLAPVWTRDGKLVAMGARMGFSIWRFHAAK
jgi:predicted Ser/Thr protein kinase